MNNYISTSIRFWMIFLIGLSLISGCSSSGDSESTTEIIASSSDENNVSADNSETDTDTENNTAGGTVNDSTGEPSNEGGTESIQADSEEPTSNSVRVTFDITVPVYSSNELQVRLVWGDIDTTAMWVTDESWTVVSELPTNTENPLLVTFNDNNGEITLGSFETNFRTGTNASESLQITAAQFDTSRWDSDNDGVSNLSELLAGTNPNGDDALEPVQASLELIPDKTFRISWQPTEGTEFYRVLENPDGISGFSAISEELGASISSFDHRVALYNRTNARYIIQSCIADRCVNSDEQIVAGTLERAVGYLKATDSNAFLQFGSSVSVSADGNTLAVSSLGNSSSVFVRVDGSWQEEFTLIGGDQANLSADGNTMAVVMGNQVVGVYSRRGSTWEEQARLEASNRGDIDLFGSALSLSGDGNTLAVGAPRESSSATGVNGDQLDNSADSSGAVYVFLRSSGVWQQQAYVKSSNTGAGDRFGASVGLSRDGNSLAVGAPGESSATTGVDGDQSDNSAIASGAVFMFTRNSNNWQQQTYIRGDLFEQETNQFGYRVAISADGVNLAVSSFNRNGTVFIFVRENSTWQQQTFLKASNTDEGDLFGEALSLSGDGRSLAVGAIGESSSARGIGGNQQENADYIEYAAGAVYFFNRQDLTWTQQAYLKASNTGPADEVCRVSSFTSEGFREFDVSGDQFGTSVSLSEDGDTLAVGAPLECSAATGFNGDQNDNSASLSGAVYLY